MDNPHLSKEYKDQVDEVMGGGSQGIIEDSVDRISLPDHRFTPQQQEIYDLVMEGKRLTFRMPYGSGKTYLHKAIMQDMALIDEAIAKRGGL